MSELTFENRFSGIDLLSDLNSLAYFEMKEVLIHYFSLSSVNYRRNFNLEAASAIDAFNRLPTTARSALHQLFTIGHREPEPAIGKTKTDKCRVPLLQSILSANSYFSIDDLADVKALNNAYRRNAKIHHPDSGGSHELMVELNFIFNKLQEKLAADNYLPPVHDDISLKVTKDYVEIDMTPLPHSTWSNWIGPLVQGNFSHGLRVFHHSDVDKALALLRVSIAIDEYDLRTALNLIHPILTKIHNGRNDFGRNAATLEASIELCRRLRAVRLDTEAVELSQNIRASKLKLHPHWPHLEKMLERATHQNERPKVNPLHPRQRNNLEKFAGAAKVGTASRLLKAKQTREVQFCNAIAALGGFIALPSDPNVVPPQAIAQKNVPQANPWTPTSSAQVREYHFTFYKSPTLDLVKKHLMLRCDMWFCAMFDASVPIDRLLAEIGTVADFIPQTLHRTPVRQRIESLILRFTFMDFVDVLLGFSPEKIRQRLDLLAEIHSRHSQVMINWVATNVIQNSHIISSGISLRDTCFPDARDTFYRESPANLSLGGQLVLSPVLVRSWRKEWFEAACAPLEHLECALKTGWMVPREEAINKIWPHYRDLSEVQMLPKN